MKDANDAWNRVHLCFFVFFHLRSGTRQKSLILISHFSHPFAACPALPACFQHAFSSYHGMPWDAMACDGTHLATFWRRFLHHRSTATTTFGHPGSSLSAQPSCFRPPTDAHNRDHGSPMDGYSHHYKTQWTTQPTAHHFMTHDPWPVGSKEGQGTDRGVTWG